MWNEEHRLFNYAVGDRLECAVLDHDFGDDADLLGVASLESADFHDDGFDGDVELKECRRGQVATLSLKIEVLPPGRFHLVVTVHSASKLIKGDDAEVSGWFCMCHPLGRPHFNAQTQQCIAASAPQWDEELQMPEYVEGDALQFHVMQQTMAPGSNVAGQQVFGIAALDSEAMRRPNGFHGEVRLSDKLAGRVGAIRVRVESVHQWELRREAEAEDRRAREERAREDERRQREREERDRHRGQEEAEERARREAEKRAAEMALRRAQDLEREFLIPVLLWPSGEVLAQVSLLARCTVLELAQRAAKAAKLPLCPVLRIGDSLLPPSQILLDAGACERNALVYAEVCPAVLTCSGDRTAKVWNATTGDCELTCSGHDGAVNSASATPDLKWIATASDDGTAKLWVVDGVTQVVAVACTMVGHLGALHSATFSQDARYLVTASADCTAKIWSIKTGQCVQTLDGHADAVLSAVFSSDGQFVKTTSSDGTTKTWETETGMCKGSVSGLDPPTAFSFTPDGNLFLTVARDVDVEVRCITTGACRQTLRGHADGVLWASFLALRAPQVSMMAAARLMRPGFAEQAVSSHQLKHEALRAGAELILNPCPATH